MLELLDWLGENWILLAATALSAALGIVTAGRRSGGRCCCFWRR